MVTELIERSQQSESHARRLSIIITCFNYRNYVETAIRSVLHESRDDCELVVVDDGSTDGSWDVIKRTGVTAYRIENGGQRAACLYGLEQTSAPFVMFLDADDCLKPGAIAEILQMLDPEVAKLQFALTRIGAEGELIDQASPSLPNYRCRARLARQVLRTGVYKSPPTSGNVFRRDLCELLRDVTYDRAVDGVILFAAPFMGDVVSTSKELGFYRIHACGDSGLGRSPDARSLKRDIDRFVARMDHLRRIAQVRNQGIELVDPREVFFYQERSFCLAIASGQRPPLSTLPRLIWKLFSGESSVKERMFMVAFFALGSIMPNRAAAILLAFRLRAGRRSPLGFLKEIVGFR